MPHDVREVKQQTHHQVNVREGLFHSLIVPVYLINFILSIYGGKNIRVTTSV